MFFSGRPSADPCHPDYVPNVFKFTKQDEHKSKMQLQRYESAKKRAKYENTVQATPDFTSSSVDKEEQQQKEQSFQIMDSFRVADEVNEAMEIDYLRKERNYLLTKISCIEQQVCDS